MTTGRHRDLPILNPNLLALKAAETLADLHRMGKYNISRVGLYQRHEQHDPAEAEEVRRRYHLVDRRCRGGRFVTVATTTVADIAGRVVRDYLGDRARASGSRSSSTTGPTSRSRPSWRAPRWPPAATRSS